MPKVPGLALKSLTTELLPTCLSASFRKSFHTPTAATSDPGRHHALPPPVLFAHCKRTSSVTAFPDYTWHSLSA